MWFLHLYKHLLLYARELFYYYFLENSAFDRVSSPPLFPLFLDFYLFIDFLDVLCQDIFLTFYLTCVSISSMSEILCFIMCILLVRLAPEFPAQVREFAGVRSLFPPHGSKDQIQVIWHGSRHLFP